MTSPVALPDKIKCKNSVVHGSDTTAERERERGVLFSYFFLIIIVFYNHRDGSVRYVGSA